MTRKCFCNSLKEVKMIKKLARFCLPESTFNNIESSWETYKKKKRFKEAYLYDLKRYLKYSESSKIKSERNLIGLIIRRYHVIEKGLTMPETRLGFGKDVIKLLINDCKQYINDFGRNDEQLVQAIAVITEYQEFHRNKNYQLENELVTMLRDIEVLKKELNFTNTSQQKDFKAFEYFGEIDSSFPIFSKSRSSIRNYSNKDIAMTDLLHALELAKTAPSACNRQSWRTYVATESDQIKIILETQGGTRGFGHLTNKLIIITSEVGVFGGISERNQAFIDGGIYAMNLLYSLHYKQIAACILNCSTTIEKDMKLRHLCNIVDSEVLIALISCGIPPEKFKAAASTRYELSKTNKIL